MLRLFKRNKKDVDVSIEEDIDVAVMEAPEALIVEDEPEIPLSIKARSNPKYDNTDIGMLHNQFYGSSEALMVESKNFLKQREKELKKWEKKEIANKKKVNDLKEFGFGNTGQAKDFDNQVKEKEEEIKCARRDIEDKTELANAVLYFSQKYPAYKFITYNGIKEVCEKYSLVFGQNKLFTGFVPKENLADIKRFWAWRDKTRVGVKMEDRAFSVPTGSDLFRDRYGDEYKTGTFIPFKVINSALKSKESDTIHYKYPSNYYEGINENRSYGRPYASNWEGNLRWDADFTREEIKAHEEAKETGSKEGLITHAEFIKRYKEKKYSDQDFMERNKKSFDDFCMDELYIAAPIEDMDMSNHRTHDYEVIPKDKLEEMKQIEDPVVFYPVSFGNIVGGLIITAWGDEAHDPLVRNERLN